MKNPTPEELMFQEANLKRDDDTFDEILEALESFGYDPCKSSMANFIKILGEQAMFARRTIKLFEKFKSEVSRRDCDM